MSQTIISSINGSVFVIRLRAAACQIDINTILWWPARLWYASSPHFQTCNSHGSRNLLSITLDFCRIWRPISAGICTNVSHADALAWLWALTSCSVSSQTPLSTILRRIWIHVPQRYFKALLLQLQALLDFHIVQHLQNLSVIARSRHFSVACALIMDVSGALMKFGHSPILRNLMLGLSIRLGDGFTPPLDTCT